MITEEGVLWHFEDETLNGVLIFYTHGSCGTVLQRLPGPSSLFGELLQFGDDVGNPEILSGPRPCSSATNSDF